MKRGYIAEEWREHMLRINEKYPKIKISTHIMVGFPSETDEDFKETLKIIDNPLNLDSIYLFKYSSRPLVRASKILEQVPDDIKDYRCNKVIQKFAYSYAMNIIQLKRSIFS